VHEAAPAGSSKRVEKENEVSLFQVLDEGDVWRARKLLASYRWPVAKIN
jgi:hypothetical protein